MSLVALSYASPESDARAAQRADDAAARRNEDKARADQKGEKFGSAAWRANQNIINHDGK
jgi:hypothetical protein